MRTFAALYEALDATASTTAKVAALRAYFAAAAPADAAWAVFFLGGQRLKRLLAPRLLAQWALEATGLAPWLFEECLAAVGDLAETMALLLEDAPHLPPLAASGHAPAPPEASLSSWIEQRILPLREAAEAERREAVWSFWRDLPDRRARFVLNKLLTGELRVGVSHTLLVRAVAEQAGLVPALVAHRMMGDWKPSPEAFLRLVAPAEAPAPADAAVAGAAEAGAPAGLSEESAARPYPFFLASPLTVAPEELGPRADYLAEWKWDGIRAQLVRRAGQTFLWSRGEELLTARFPELAELAAALPDGTVLDGEVLATRDGAPLPFSVLQRRVGRQKLTPAILADAPAGLMAYDLLEQHGRDLRAEPLRERRARLEALQAAARSPRFLLSAAVDDADWAGLRARRAEARARGVEGLMLKRLDSPYQSGRRRGDWWKWKIDPFSIDAVLLYAQPGSGRRASVLTDMTFGLWSGDALLPVAKAYSGLTDAELDQMDVWIRQNTLERFGPVRRVAPVQVFELHFEGIALSTRHKSGVAVRFPRIARWRTDKPAAEADRLETLRALATARN